MSMAELKRLYQEMYELTNPECHTCRVPLSCCDPFYCEVARSIAKSHNVELLDTGHPTLPFMGKKGCIVPPYLRPICTVHTCAVGNLGYKPNDPEWTEKYFALREKIDALEFDLSTDVSKTRRLAFLESLVSVNETGLKPLDASPQVQADLDMLTTLMPDLIKELKE